MLRMFGRTPNQDGNLLPSPRRKTLPLSPLAVSRFCLSAYLHFWILAFPSAPSPLRGQMHFPPASPIGCRAFSCFRSASFPLHRIIPRFITCSVVCFGPPFCLCSFFLPDANAEGADQTLNESRRHECSTPKTKKDEEFQKTIPPCGFCRLLNTARVLGEKRGHRPFAGHAEEVRGGPAGNVVAG